MTEHEAEAAARLCGVDEARAMVLSERIVINYSGEITFDVLTKLSERFGTKRIDLGVDRGCASDPSTDPYIIVWL